MQQNVTGADTAGAYTIRTLATRLAVSPKTVWRWHHSGRLPGRIRAGRAVRYDRTAIERKLLSGELLLPDTAKTQTFA